MSKPVNLALQGGGAHGAFTWGVADRLLECGTLHLSAITATSAGAMNAAVIAYGLEIGGPDGAREKLRDFWREISSVRETFGLFDVPFTGLIPFYDQTERMASYFAMEALHIAASPYQLNPLGLNPLKDVIERTIDFDVLHGCQATKLFISATNVKSGKVRVFSERDVTVDALLASACLPQLFQAVEIDGEHYWDGGYMGNPSLWPLFYETDVEDLLVVHINPIARDKVPTTPSAISNRVNEITFNSALLKEMRSIAFVQKLMNKKWLTKEGRENLSDIRFHAIRAEHVFHDLSVASKFDTSWDFLTGLMERGREEADRWIKANAGDVGEKSTVDLHAEFLDV